MNTPLYVGGTLAKQKPAPRLNSIESAMVELMGARTVKSDLIPNLCSECQGEGEASYSNAHPHDPDGIEYRDTCERCHGECFAACPACGVPSESIVYGDGRCAECVAVDVAESEVTE